jgi:beta-lactamase superfamily II metal-dependent hydrolase
VYFVDVEGGQATLFVAPSGQTMLVDSGFPGDRDPDRIVAVATAAGVKQIDYFVNTHYHADHIGGVSTLAPKLPMRVFVDHGPSIEPPGTPGVSRGTLQAFDAYTAIRDRGQHIVAKPGDTLPIAGLGVSIVSAAARTITVPLAGAGAANPACAGFVPKDESTDIQLGNENAQSVGMVISYGRFRILDLGDLTWNHEHDLACPRNLVGTVDVYLTTHHGQNISSLPALVRAVAPRVAIMNNGGRKGGAVETFQTLHALPGLRDLWQLHFAVAAGAEHNAPEQFIANPDDSTAHYMKLAARQDGSFTVTNTRNGFEKTYPPRDQ